MIRPIPAHRLKPAKKPSRKTKDEPSPTGEQELICSTDLALGELMVIEAYAGSGKSSTGRYYTRRRPEQRFLYLCYNRELAIEARASFPRNVSCMTMHALAYETHGKPFNQRKGKLGNLRPKDVMLRLKLKSPVVAVLVIQTLANFLCSTDAAVGDAHVPARSGLDREYLIRLASEAWVCMCSLDDPLPMPHDGYLKLWAASKPVTPGYDLLFVDEAQDLNPITADYAFRMRAEKAAGVIMVGDSHQSIYSFRMAVNAISDAAKVADHRMALTWCFRFDQEIADQASRVLNALKGDPVRLVGAGKHPPGDDCMVVGRTNAGLIQHAALFLSKNPGAKLNFAGTSEADHWQPGKAYRFDEVRDVYALFKGRPGEVKTEYFKKFAGWDEVEEFVEEAGDIELGAIHKLVDEHRDEIPALLASIEASSGDAKDSSMSLSTAHRSKGRQATYVKLLDDFKPVWEPQEQADARESFAAKRKFEEEVNLLYVAMTRPRFELRIPDTLAMWLQSQPLNPIKSS